MLIKPFKFQHYNNFEPREDRETQYNYYRFIGNPEYKPFINANVQMYTMFHTIPTTKKQVILGFFGGYRTMPGTAEMILCPSRYFDRNVLQCLKVLRKVISEERDKYIPYDVHRLEMNCNLEYPEMIRFALKGMKFNTVGIRHKYGAEKQEDYLLLEKVL